ncbi:hypothetical protein [Hydrogenophaga sp.]|uniref:hypothetical protein n=1 Tax=Hydrogenophaga sp. TaxID=1904254 RepID=UPI002621496D|nr:hypothetical protein [Hydrogenophaga sp.]MDM7950853.1 hypothetical protein [Hydrogenophaga sp.]
MQESAATPTSKAAANASPDAATVQIKTTSPKAVKPASTSPQTGARVPAPKRTAPPLKKAAATPVSTKASVPTKNATKPKVVKASSQRPQKIKLVRDSFTFPESDHRSLVDLKKRVIALGIEVKKGELVRAALDLLASLDNQRLLKAIASVEKLKTGRPKK